MSNKQISQTILQQIGGNRFLAMTGAKNLVSASDSLSFSIPKNASKANRCVITLNEGTDLYRVEFWVVKVKSGKVECIHDYKSVYADALSDIFAAYTGMAVAL